MKTINNYTNKLQESTQKRNEAWIELNKCISLYQHDLPEEFINAWVRFERWEKEANRIEVEAIKGIEQEVGRLQNSNNEEKKILALSNYVLSKMLVLSFIVLISHLISLYLVGVPEPRPVNPSFMTLRSNVNFSWAESTHPP